MKKIGLVFVVILAIVFATSLTVNRMEKRDFTYEYKGWPFTYQKTVDTYGLCIGFDGAKEITPCGLRGYPINYTSLAGNFALSLAVATVLTYGLRQTKLI